MKNSSLFRPDPRLNLPCNAALILQIVTSCPAGWMKNNESIELETITWKCTQISQPQSDFCSGATQNVKLAVSTDCRNSTARSKLQGNVKDSKFKQNGTNLNNSKPTNHLSTNPSTTAIFLLHIFFQIWRFWIWFLAKNTPHWTSLCVPFQAKPTMKGFLLATRTLVGGLADVSPGTPTMCS